MLTTFHSPILSDIAVYCRAGVRGLGMWEYKLEGMDDGAVVEQLERAGLVATLCFPKVKGILPGDAFDRLYGYPTRLSERLPAIMGGIRRLAGYQPTAICLLTGPPTDDRRHDLRSVRNALREAAYLGGELGVSIALEGIRADGASLTPTLGECFELVESIGVPNVGVLLDTWQFKDGDEALRQVRQYGGQVAGIQVSDRAKECRGGMDRRLPGEGDMGVPAILAAAREASFDGWYEVEIFSDDGTFGEVYSDSLWTKPPGDVVASAVASFTRAWEG